MIAIVGMPGSGKTEACKFLESLGFKRIYFGGIVTQKEIPKRGLELNEENEKKVREELREKHGMEAMAKLNKPKIDKALEDGKKVIIDGLYSWEEYKFLKEKYGDKIKVISIYASPKVRHERLKTRKERPLNEKDCKERDKNQIENLHTGGPIAMADFTVSSERPMEKTHEELKKIVGEIK